MSNREQVARALREQHGEYLVSRGYRPLSTTWDTMPDERKEKWYALAAAAERTMAVSDKPAWTPTAREAENARARARQAELQRDFLRMRDEDGLTLRELVDKLEALGWVDTYKVWADGCDCTNPVIDVVLDEETGLVTLKVAT